MQINSMQEFSKNLKKIKIGNLHDDNIHIWKIDFTKISSNIKTYLYLLNNDEISRANKFLLKNKYKSYIATRIILKILLQYYINREGYKIQLHKNQYGKPYLKDNEIYFNISHTSDMSLIAFSKNKEFGIDLESNECDNNIVNISAKYFTQREKNWIENLPNNKKTKGFIYCWVRKEAYIKALGLGLSLPLDSFNVISQEQKKISDNKFQIKKWFLHPLDISINHLGAICIQAPKIDLIYFDASKII
ncbi:hypothetical protein CRV00_05770 [Malaciobacter molluscorum]|uniref:4'-phosphopantetheinyl transferase family protein n=1 Tax=Malaciobacter molluscorum TaxID=1032072 RepID=UPI00100BE883|nr:4'-phosphopantetheinyl transferase superfamily protein [Malaciobacter molluscorum]RXJ94839.1 hypothetical protein CRV00_05770 [Malaciobacter molluscorum]